MLTSLSRSHNYRGGPFMVLAKLPIWVTDEGMILVPNAFLLNA